MPRDLRGGEKKKPEAEDWTSIHAKLRPPRHTHTPAHLTTPQKLVMIPLSSLSGIGGQEVPVGSLGLWGQAGSYDLMQM